MSTSTLAQFALHYVHHWALRKKVTISRLHYRQETGGKDQSLRSHLAALEMCVCARMC